MFNHKLEHNPYSGHIYVYKKIYLNGQIGIYGQTWFDKWYLDLSIWTPICFWNMILGFDIWYLKYDYLNSSYAFDYVFLNMIFEFDYHNVIR